MNNSSSDRKVCKFHFRKDKASAPLAEVDSESSETEVARTLMDMAVPPFPRQTK